MTTSAAVPLSELCMNAFYDIKDGPTFSAGLPDATYGLHARTNTVIGTPDYYFLLAGLAQTLYQNHPRILELGTFMGGSAKALAIGAGPDAVVVTVDRVLKGPVAFPFYPQIRRITGDSLAPDTTAQVATHISDIDLLFIDSHHTGPHLLAELEIYANQPFSPTLIVLDDIHLNESMDEIWQQLSTVGPDSSFEAFDASELVGRPCGFGVLRRRPQI